MMTVEEIIEKYTNENGFLFGIDTVMQCLRPGAIYSLSSEGGEFIIVHWDDKNVMIAPTSAEIREEYIRHQTIKETLDYIKSVEDRSVWEKIIRKLIKQLEKTI